jgi:hypothetical protein
MNKGRVGEESRGKEMDGCPLTVSLNCWPTNGITIIIRDDRRDRWINMDPQVICRCIAIVLVFKVNTAKDQTY